MSAATNGSGSSASSDAKGTWTDMTPSAEFDAVMSMSKFMEPVLLLDMLRWVQENSVYDRDSLLRSRLKLASRMRRPALCAAMHEELHGAAPKEGEYGSQETMKKAYNDLCERSGALLKLVDPETGSLQPSQRALELFQEGTFTRQQLLEHEGVTVDEIEAFSQLARFVFECGPELDGDMNGFACSGFYLVYYRQLVADEEPEAVPALWGKLLSEVLTKSVQYARQDLDALAEQIRRHAFPSEADRAVQRASMLHAALFPCLGADADASGTDGLAMLVQLFLEERANNHVIRMHCPWLVRYVVFALVTLGKLEDERPRLLGLLDDVADRASDPLVDLALALVREHDLESARSALKACEQVIASDFFLSSVAGAGAGAGGEREGAGGSLSDLFLESARKQVYQLYCKLHSTVDIKKVAEELRVEEEEAERWIVQLVRGAGLTARIDTRGKQVRMRAAVQSPHARLAQMASAVADQAGAVADSIGDHVAAIKGKEAQAAGGAASGAGSGGGAGGGYGGSGGGVMAALSRGASGRSRGR